jgi:hypothetical protein
MTFLFFFFFFFFFLQNPSGGKVAIGSVVAVPAERWDKGYILPKKKCLARGGKCVEGRFPAIPGSTRVSACYFFPTSHKPHITAIFSVLGSSRGSSITPYDDELILLCSLLQLRKFSCIFTSFDVFTSFNEHLIT